MSQIETVVRGSKKLEKILKEDFGAQGRGLHEYLTDVESQLTEGIVRKGRYIASVRNKVIHDDEDIYDIKKFNDAVEEVEAALNEILQRRKIEQERAAKLKQSKAGRPDQGATTQVIYRGGSGALKLACALSIIAALWMLELFDNQKSETVKSQREVKEVREKLLTANSEIASLRIKVTSATVRGPDDDKKEVEKLQAELKLANRELQSLRAKMASAKKVTNVPKVASTARVEEQSKPQVNSGFSSSLLAKAEASGNEYEVAKNDILNNFSNVVKNKSRIVLGEPDVSVNSSGTYDVRIPVSWSVPTNETLGILNRYFNTYGRKPLRQISDRIKLEARYAESSTAIKPYSGRLFKDLQKLEFRVIVELAGKSASIVMGSNVRCHVGCRPTREPSDGWLIQMDAKPGTRMLGYKDESPIVIRGLTQQDIAKAGRPRAYIQ